jgi:hypothetical protein
MQSGSGVIFSIICAVINNLCNERKKPEKRAKKWNFCIENTKNRKLWSGKQYNSNMYYNEEKQVKLFYERKK